MGNRFLENRRKRTHVQGYCLFWAGLHQGKYWKRQMHKARRRAWKQNGIEGTPQNKYESYCNYKGW